MWFSVPSPESLNRPRVAIAALVSSVAVASGIYYAYHRAHSTSEFVYAGGLHRSNAIRRARRREGAASPQPSTSSSQDQNEAPDGDDGQRDGETVIDDEGRSVGAWYDEPPQQRVGHNIVNLLFRVSEDNSRRNASIHRGCQCNVCGTAPIRGIRYRCANCADFDLCESCESQGLHIKTHVFYKIKVPAPPPGLRQMQPVWYTGDPDSVSKSLPRHLISKLSKETGFERPELEACWEQWTFMANTEWRDDPDGLNLAMDRKTFERCLITSGGSRHTAPNLLHDRMFAFYDTNKDGLIGFTEFLHALSYRQRRDRLKRVFEGYDINGDGYIDRKDCLRMFRAYYVLYKQMHKDVLDGLDEQGMSSTEVQQLATGRQPISSLFGRDLNRMPSAEPVPETLHGKTRGPNGHVELAPGGGGFLREYKGDVASRRQVLTRLFWGNLLEGEDFLAPPQYAEALLGPLSGVPAIEELLSTLESMASDQAPLEMMQTTSSGEEAGASQSQTPEGDVDELDQENNTSAEGRCSSQEELEDSSRNGDSATDRPAANGGFHVSHNDGRLRVTIPERRLSPRKETSIKKKVRHRLYERWLRRQFYLDEEEGGKPPREWKEDDDILTRIMGELRDRKGTARGDEEGEPSCLSPRSRSSSKVRFATDGDDFETRSNHSSASRTVPERWGGMDIPDAERDAGKEIMYQIAQQAFNEMLDPLFKPSEDMAMVLAETREERRKYAYKIAETFEAEFVELGFAADGTTPPRTDSPGHVYDFDESQEPEDACGERGHADEIYHDPTMPQFRPNSDADASMPPTSAPAEETERKLSSKAQGKRRATAEAGADDDIPFDRINTWRNFNIEERKALERGGFGRLNYDEFESLYKEQESLGHRLDYLGSWIDFCIP